VRAGLEPGFVRFFVEDTGAGIDEEHLGLLFEQFYRAPGQDENSGIGLGLSIAREIIQAHGGDVTVESRLGEGSIFSFILPLTTGRGPEENQLIQKGDR
jgi:signal transduction histidine kinase